MKKILLIIAAFSFAVSASAGEPSKKTRNFLAKDDGDKCFDENTHIINLGVGFGRRSYNHFAGAVGYRSGMTPAFSLSYEQAWKQKLGPGYLGVGAYFGFQHEYYEYDYGYYNNSWLYNTYYYKRSWNHYLVAARAAYHWDVLNSKNAEVYAGVIIGMRFQTYSYTTNDPGNKDPYSYTNTFAYPAYTVFAGARWYFAKNFGLFAEVGYGISYGTVGMSIKF